MDKKWYLRIYMGMLLIALLFTVFAFLTSGGEQIQSRKENTSGAVIFPTTVRDLDAVTREYLFSAKGINDGDKCLIFYTRHQIVKGYMNGALTYSLRAGNPSFGSTPGALWNFVKIPYGAGQIQIQIQEVYEEKSGGEPVFFYGQAGDYFLHLLKQAFPAGALSIMIIMMGIILLMYGFYGYRSQSQSSNSLIYLGLFSSVMGFWSLLESDFSGLILHNQQGVSFFRFVLLLLLGLPFGLFVKNFLQLELERVWNILCIMDLLWIPTCLALQLLRIRDFNQTVFITHMLYLCILLYLGAGIWQKRKEDKLDRAGQHRLKLFFIGTLFILIAVLINMYGFYHNISGLDMASRLAAILYMLMAGYLSVKDLERIIAAGKQAEVYRTLAVTDVLTGMYNRNAYIERISRVENPNNMMILTFDLNNLKQCNDIQGHMFGDKYIIASAGILANVFAPCGECYRIGGDEFCVVVPDAAGCKVQELLESLEHKQEDFNRTSTDIFMQIAYGYAIYEPGKDRDIEGTRSRADEHMYEHKRLLKERTGLGR